MEREAVTVNRRRTLMAVLGAVVALTALMACLMGCAPQAKPAASDSGDAATEESADPMAGQPVNWTMESDCATCHTVEAESATDAACPQDVAHEAEDITCVQCHTQEDVLATEHADVKFGDKPASKATVDTVDPATCISCPRP